MTMTILQPLPTVQQHETFGSVCCKLLRGERLLWPFGYDPLVVDNFISDIIFHGVDCLVYDRLAQLADCPARLRSQLQQRAIGRAAWELRNRTLMQQAVMALAAAGIESLVYKGTALAYTLYDNPVWRTRSDTDLLVTPENRDAAIAILAGDGYRQVSASEEVVYYKLYFTKKPPEGGEHNIDLHWRLNNSELLSRIFSHDELRQRATRLSKLGEAALTIDSVDALLIACLHRGAHKQAVYTVGEREEMTGDRLIWCYDIDLLARRLNAVQWREFFVRAKAKGLTSICAESLLLARDCFHTPLPPAWNSALAVNTPSAADVYLGAGSLRRLWLDMLACETLSARISYCLHLLFPPAAYMRGKYGNATVQWLPLLYLRRVAEGLFKRLPSAGAG